MPASRRNLILTANIVVAVAMVLIVARPLSADWQSIGALKAEQPDGTQLTFRGPHGIARISVLAPDLIRVRISNSADFGPDRSWAVIKGDWPPAMAEFDYQGTRRIIRTPELEVRVETDPFRVSFYDRQGNLIAKDDDKHPTAWDGARVRAWKWLPADEHYFGLGEKAGPLDRRGRAFVNWNTDAYGWGPTTDPLYDDIPFYLGLNHGRAYGMFFDNTYRSSFDFGVESPALASFGAEGGEMNYYFFWGPQPRKVISRYTELVGHMPMPPLWALGYHQCRYSYYPENVVRSIAANFRVRHIPCDALFLDIHYMDGYRIFTWDKTRFPDPPAMLGDLHRQGFHVVTIVDPGIKVDPNYAAYRSGLEGDDFAKLPDGKVFVGKVWPGEAAFPDFTAARVRTWWGSLFKGLLADGVDGIWNDMNEPSVFEVPNKTMPDDVVFDDEGHHSPETRIHNVFGMQMSRATHDGLVTLKPGERPLVITRATYAGGQRYAAVWTGDNSSTWEHLRMSLPEIMNMGISGLALVGADIGGFAGGGASPELYTRWLETGVFYPYCRTHVEYGAPNQEPWSYGNRKEAMNRSAIELRYRLLPYLYNAFREASVDGVPVMRALLLDYPDDETAIGEDTEFLFGDDLLVAPVLKDGAVERDVYLPKGVWYDFHTGRRYAGPKTIDVQAPLGTVPLFVRGGAILPTRQLVQYVGEAPIDPLTFEVYPAAPGEPSERDYYEDDGISFNFESGASLQEKVSVASGPDSLELRLGAREGGYAPPARSVAFTIHAQRQSPGAVTADGRAVPALASVEALQSAAAGWIYDEDQSAVEIKLPDTGQARAIRVAFGGAGARP